jgi:hypothetical protein
VKSYSKMELMKAVADQQLIVVDDAHNTSFNKYNGNRYRRPYCQGRS